MTQRAARGEKQVVSGRLRTWLDSIDQMQLS